MKSNKLKYIFLLLGILISRITISQVEMIEDEFIEYNEELAKSDYKIAIQLEYSGSLNKAINHYRHVAKFDSTSEIGKLSKGKLDSIWVIETELFQSKLSGAWRWIWSGTNWGTEDSPKKCSCERYMKFEGDEILIFEGKEEKERFPYQIIKDIDRIGTGYFLIDVNNGDKILQFRIYEKIENYFFLAERSKDDTLFLEYKDEGLIPNCVCGCPEKRFEKI